MQDMFAPRLEFL
jgi:hypothetical protein